MLQLTGKVEGDAFSKLRKLEEQFTQLHGSFVSIGWDSSQKYSDGTLVANVALFQELGTFNANGTVHVPARPFMRPAYQDNRAAIAKLRVQAIQDVVDGKITSEKALNRIGYQIQQFIAAKIKANPGPPLALRTLAAKRAAGRPAVTLIDTRRMLETLSYKVYMADAAAAPPPSEPGPNSPNAPSGPPSRNTTSAGDGVGHNNGGTAGRQVIPPTVPDSRATKAEKKRLRDELKKAQQEKKRKAPPQAPKKDHTAGTRNRPKKPTTPKPPTPPKNGGRKPRAPKEPRTPQNLPGKRRAPARKGASKTVKTVQRRVKKAAKSIRTRVKKAAKAVRRSTKTAKKVLKSTLRRIKKTAKAMAKSIKKLGKVAAKSMRNLTKAIAQTLRKSLRKTLRSLRSRSRARRTFQARAHARAHAAHHSSFFASLEASLLHAIIHLAHSTSTYGRKLI